MKTWCGTPMYMAPEVLNGDYNELCDVWSLGIILHLLLIGSPAFYSDDIEEMKQQIQDHKKLEFADEAWDQISDDAKDLVSKMLSPQHQRISMKMVLEH